MSHRKLMILGVVFPTLAAALFEWSVLSIRDNPPSVQEVVGRIALMFFAASFFTSFMFALIKRHRRDVEHQSRRFEDLFQNSHQGIILIDEGRRVTASNPQAREMLGFSEANPISDLCQLCCLPSGQRCQGACPILERDDGPVFRTNLRRCNGALVGTMMCVSHLPPKGDNGGETVLRFTELSQIESKEQARISRLITRKMLEAREEERRRLARELHDGIGQELYALRLAAQTQQSVDAMAQQLMEEVDNLAKQLWPPVLEKLGLCKALEEAFRPYANVQVACTQDLGSMSLALKAALYRIAQEAVTNALKHAEAGSISVKLDRRDNDIFLLVQDDGKGFSPEQPEADGTLGLASMRERAELAHGVFSVNSQVGRGTEVEVCLPVLRESESVS